LSDTYTNILIHALFSTRDREPWLTPEIRDEAFRYLGGTLNELGGQSLLVNGPSDHVHMLFVQPRTLSIACVMERVKTNSSGWMKDRWPDRGYFGWQTGYAACSVSQSHVEQVKLYIGNQLQHHRKVSFQEEVQAFLKKQGVEYDPRYVFCVTRYQISPAPGMEDFSLLDFSAGETVEDPNQ
jgi:REP element-mobilizing transposase RayT